MSSADASTAAAAGVSTDAAAAVAAPLATAKQLTFWQNSLREYKNNMMTAMLLHTDQGEAEDMNEGEVAEILEACDFQKEWTVCEWAAGMGRLTPLLASHTSFVYASDFVQDFCTANQKRCESLNVKNVQIDCIDAATYSPTATGTPPHKNDLFDMQFINWLLLYLDDATAEKFVRAAKDGLKRRISGRAGRASSTPSSTSQSGWIFLHESCWERVNEKKIFEALPKEQQEKLLATPCEKYEECQTYYRTSYWYCNLFAKLGLELVKEFELKVYATWGVEAATAQPTPEAENEAYNRQMCWILRIQE